jgi:hypothetical protein
MEVKEQTARNLRGAPADEQVPVLLWGDAPLPDGLAEADVLRVNIEELVEGRLLVEADPGSGKTHMLWSFGEQLAGKVPQLIVDPEGEYAPLRRAGDYVLVGADPTEADVLAHPATAAELTRFLVEHNLSAIFDLFEMEDEQQVLFVAEVAGTLRRLPKEHWRTPRALIVDEAQAFAPEKENPPSKAALASLSQRGRKRGVLTVFATPSLADFSKSVARGINNKLVARTTLDTHVRRVAEDLGLDRAGRLRLMNLPDKRFLVRGQAFGVRGLGIADVAPVRTRPPRKEARFAPPPPASESMREILEALRDLRPPEPEVEDTDDPAELRQRVRALRSELDAARDGAHRPAAPDPDALEREVSRRLKERLDAEKEEALRTLREEISALRRRLDEARSGAADLLDLLAGESPGPDDEDRQKGEAHSPPEPEPAAREEPQAARPSGSPGPRPVPELDALSEPRRRILEELAFFEGHGLGRVHRANLAVLADQSPRSSSYAAHLSAMHAEGLVSYPEPGWISLAGGGREALDGAAEAPRRGRATPREELRDAWLRYLPEAQRKILKALLDRHPEDLARDQLARLSDQSPRSSSYADHLASMKSLGLAAYPKPGRVAAGELFFPEAGFR